MENLKETREKKGLTQTEAAQAIGVSVEAYRRWENGGGNPSPENMEKLKKVLGLKETLQEV